MVRGANYQRQWSDLKRRKWLFWLLMLGVLPGIAASLLIVYLLWPAAPDATFVVIVLGWALAMAAANANLLAFTCPNCGGHFFMTAARLRNPFTSKCMQCGLPRGADPADLKSWK
jgi:hypothetical protein